MSQLSELERRALQAMVGEHSHAWTGLLKYLDERRISCEQACAAQMRLVPRNLELASDYAAKAEAFEYLPAQLESFAREL